ncbi:MAG: hypothetical protein KDI01_02320 [Halioglobus sp.]|nr:hypothetical protein [Halioglobus sp.]
MTERRCPGFLAAVFILLALPSGQGPAAAEAAAVNLLVSVASGAERAAASDVAGAAGRTYQSAPRHLPQQLQVLSGHAAYVGYTRAEPYPVIAAGVELYGPRALVALQERSVRSGFRVTPTLQGGRVLLEIGAVREQPSHRDGATIAGTAVQSTVSGELGQWLRLTGSARGASAAGGGGRTYATGPRRSEREREIWVRVQRVE